MNTINPQHGGTIAARLSADPEPLQLTDIAEQCKDVILAAESAGLTIDDGNVVDLCADNIPASLSDIRSALVVAGLGSRFPRAISYPSDQSVRACRECGCTDDDCLQCVLKTGEPCHWVEWDLCSACQGGGA